MHVYKNVTIAEKKQKMWYIIFIFDASLIFIFELTREQ